MKLIECYVNNFGKLSNFSYKFGDKLNVIREDNGFGKSTLAAFIKSMLFGLEDTKRPSLSENDRKKYEPWQGGAWGGSLTVSHGGKNYRIERSFSKKASLDELRVYELETGKLSDAFSEKSPGEIFFGIDRDGFERTAFLSERDIDEKKANNTVSAKLSRLTGIAFDMTELDSATKLLEEERKYYRKHGGGGAISDITEKISELEYRKAELLTLEAAHEADAKEIHEKESEIKLLKTLAEKEIEEEKASALTESRREEYKRKLSEKSEYDKRAENIRNFFGGKIPEKETFYRIDSAKDELARLKREKAELEKRLAAYPTLPDESEIDTALHLSLKIKENQEKSRKLEIEKLNTGAILSKKIKLFSIFGISFIALGAILAFVSLPLLLTSLLGVGLLLFAFTLSKKKSSSAKEPQISELAFSLQQDEKRLSDFFERFSPEEKTAEFAIPDLKRKLKEKESIEAAKKAKDEEFASLYEKYLRIAEAYPAINEYPSVELISKAESYDYLTSSSERLEKECRELMEKFNFKEDSPKHAGERASDKLIAKERELSLLKNKFSLDEMTLEGLDDVNASIEILRESADMARYKYEIIKKTKSYLEAAKDSLTSKYLGKTRDAFSYYAKAVSNATGEFGLDTSFAVTKTESGQTRVKDSFSKGTQKLYDFAIRLSFADSLYEGELPFLMLDDPFAYFDDEKISSALSLLKEISKTRQIIYFTAAKSRA